MLALLGATWAAEAQNHLPWTFFKEQYLGLFLGLALAAVFVGVRSHRRDVDRVPWHDWLLATAGLASGLYVAVYYPSIAYQLARLTIDKTAFGIVAILLVLEATRRLVGWVMVVLGGAFILYAHFAYLLPGLFNARGSSWSRIAVYLYLDTSGLFGLPLTVTAGMVAAFILFGQVLYAVGGDRFLTDLATAMMGRYRGGPAKVSVAASCLFGTVSGSAVSNVVVDGPITIPMMKRTGYAPHLACAIEAVASTGGQIMPPVMGVAAFLIAEFLAVPYSAVAWAALIPALLYFLAVFVQVDLEAAKHGLLGLPADRLPKFRAVLSRGWVFLVPLGVLLYTLMVAAWQPGRAGMAAVAVTVVVGILQRSDRLTWRRLLHALEATGRILLDIVAITAVAGLVIGVLQLSGLGFKFSLILVNAAGGNSFLLLVMTAAICIVLGMGMPTAIVYIMLAVLVGPALVQLGIAPLGAHLFVFYFGMLSMITPPVCLATYAAASIGGADFMRTGWTGLRLGIVAYIVPFVFVYQPALLMTGAPVAVVLAAATAVVGVVLLSVACVGFLFRPLGLGRRALAAAAGVLLIPPPSEPYLLTANVVGLAVGAAVVATAWTTQPRRAAERGAVAP